MSLTEPWLTELHKVTKLVVKRASLRLYEDSQSPYKLGLTELGLTEPLMGVTDFQDVLLLGSLSLWLKSLTSGSLSPKGPLDVINAAASRRSSIERNHLIWPPFKETPKKLICKKPCLPAKQISNT